MWEYVDGTNLRSCSSRDAPGRQDAREPGAVHPLMVSGGPGATTSWSTPRPTTAPRHRPSRHSAPPTSSPRATARVKLADFGLARPPADRVHRSRRGQGQVQLPLPEAASGRISIAGPTYSPSAFCLRAVHREAPVRRERLPDRSGWYGRRYVPSITQQNPGVEPELEAIIRRRWLERWPPGRTAGELQVALAQTRSLGISPPFPGAQPARRSGRQGVAAGQSLP